MDRSKARRIIPFDPDVKRVAPYQVRQRLGSIPPKSLDGLIERGELTIMAVVPGVQAYIVEASVDAYIERLNATATVAAQ